MTCMCGMFSGNQHQALLITFIPNQSPIESCCNTHCKPICKPKYIPLQTQQQHSYLQLQAQVNLSLKVPLDSVSINKLYFRTPSLCNYVFLRPAPIFISTPQLTHSRFWPIVPPMKAVWWERQGRCFQK